MHPAHLRGDILSRASFVKVHATLRNHERTMPEVPENESPGMTGDARHRKPGDLRVRNARGDIDLLDESSKPGAKHEAEMRTECLPRHTGSLKARHRRLNCEVAATPRSTPATFTASLRAA